MVLRALIIFFVFQLPPSEKQYGSVKTPLQETIKTAAFQILQTKCNACHAIKKKTDIFTLENMNTLAPDIWEQVFVKKKMPKGRKIKLTEEESNKLETWLDTVLSMQK